MPNFPAIRFCLILLCRPKFHLGRKACGREQSYSFFFPGWRRVVFFSMSENCGSFVWRTLKAIGFLPCFLNVGVSCDEVKCKIYTTSSQNFLTSLLIINSIHLEKRSACQWAKSFRRQYSSLSVQKGCPEATDGKEPRDKWLSNIREGLLAQVRLWFRSTMYLLQADHG